MALVFPTPAQAAAQTPVNTFSPTSTPLVNTSNNFTYTYNTAKGVWVIAGGGGGGGGGTVTNVTGTAPILSSGGATPNISLANTTVTPGAYTYASFTVDSTGRLTVASNGVAPATTVTSPITNTGTAVAPNIGILPASTTQSGAVQLNDTVTSTSTTQALTAAQGKSLQDQINALVVTSNLTLAGTINASTGLLDSVTAAGSAAIPAFTLGAALPSPVAGLLDYFVIVTNAGSYDPPGPGGPYSATQGDWFLCDGTQWQFLNVGPGVVSASDTQEGVVELATTAETQTGTNANLAVTPAGAAGTYVPKALYAAKGDILAGSAAASTPVVLGVGADGLLLSADSTAPSGLSWIPAPAGGGGTVTSITAGTGLSGGVITTVGTIALSPATSAALGGVIPDGANITISGTGAINLGNTAVTPGSYTYASITVNAQGRITAASDGVAPVTAVTGTAPISVTAGSTPVVSVADATALVKGVVELATPAEVQTSTDNVRAVTPIGAACTYIAYSGPNSRLTAKGSLITASAAFTPFELVVSATDNQVLVTCAACTGGLTWAAIPPPADATPSTTGVVYGCTAANGRTALGFLALFANTGTGNVAIGGSALRANTTAINNVAVGQDALRCNTTGNTNTGVGACALNANTTGVSNVGVGIGALVGNTSGCFNVAIGQCAGGDITTGCNNVAIGCNVQVATATANNQLAIGFSNTENWLTGTSTKAIKPGAGIIDCAGSCGTAGQVLMSNGSNAICWGAVTAAVPAATATTLGAVFGRMFTGDNNTAIGNNAQLSRSFGTNNTAMGFDSQRALTNGNCNTAFGACTQRALTTGLNNVAVGHCSSAAITTGNSNVSVGNCSLLAATTGCCNTAIGDSALNSVTTANGNVGIGASAGTNTTTGCNNTFVGSQAGLGTTGENNVFIGSQAGQGQTSVNGSIFIGSRNGGGAYAPVGAGAVNFTTTSNIISMGHTSITTAYVQVAWTVSSDARDKTNIKSLPVGLEFVNQLNPVSYQFRENRDSDEAHGPVRYGFLAQEVLEAEGDDPVIISGSEDKLHMTPDNLNAVFAKAIQELSAQVEELKAKVAELEAQG